MPDNFLNFAQDIFKEERALIFEKKIIQKMFPNEKFDRFTDNGFFKKVTGDKLHNKTVLIDSTAGSCEYNSYYEDGVYTLEPEEQEIPPIKAISLDYDFGEIYRENLIEKLLLKNDYSKSSMSYPENIKLLFVGERVIKAKKVVWMHCLASVAFEELVEQHFEMQKYGIDFLICSQIGSSISGIDPNNFKVGIVGLGHTFLIGPIVYLKFFNPLSLDEIINLQNYPVLIDVKNKYVYLYGLKVNLTSETNLYKFLVELFRIPSGVAFKNEDFYQNYYNSQSSNGEASYTALASRSKELRKQLKRIFFQNPKNLNYFKSALLCQARGKVKCEIPSSTVFWWPGKPST